MNGLPPRRTPISQPFWDGLDQDEIRLQQCSDCSRLIFYPRPFCPWCSGSRLAWKTISDTPTLFTFAVAAAPVSAAYDHLDHPILAVADIGGAHLPTSIVETDVETIRIGMALQPVFDRETYPDVTLLRFKGTIGAA